MCESSRYVSFVMGFRGVEYRAKVTSIDDGVEITLPGFRSFEDLVGKACEDLPEGEVALIAAEERERCLLEGIQRMRGDLE